MAAPSNGAGTAENYASTGAVGSNNDVGNIY